MESVGVFPDGEWDSFGSIFHTDEVDSLTRYLGNSLLAENYDAGVNSAWQTFFDPPASISINGVNKSWSHSLDALTADFNPRKHDYSHSSYHTSQPNDTSVFIDMNSIGVKKTCSFLPSLTENLEEGHHRAPCLGGDIGSHGCENSDNHLPTSTAMKSSNEEEKLKRKLNCRLQNTQLADNGKKKNRVSQHVQKSAVDPPKSTYKSVNNSSKTSVREDGNGGSQGQSSSSNSSDDENASRDNNGGSTSSSKTGKVIISNEKTRAARGSATDPQSIYARKRRERINERLRILQKLVPNGTKVDISTMLEEAVHYVKFLQLQIKLLSSDDHWMYAPIAYNGMDIGLHQKIINPLLFH